MYIMNSKVFKYSHITYGNYVKAYVISISLYIYRMLIMNMEELSLEEKREIMEELSKEEYGTYGTVKIGEIRGQLMARIPQRIRRQLELKKGDIVEISVNPKEKQIVLRVLEHGKAIPKK